jgi:16S rRNA A1518/A1519 N6-dimethyltransferase RsmA/KsgA/DIM1 with predicted DNA glycosylase/AP lyase activity
MKNNYSINQNFLVNRDLVKKLLKKTNFKPENLIIDIGVGEGAISQELLENKHKVLGFEIDKKFYDNISQKLDSPNFKILNQDFLDFKLTTLKENYSIFSNIPFNQTTKIVQKILIENAKADEVYLIMQEESANRFLGKKEGLLVSLLILNNYTAEIIHKFKKTDFSPVPKVNIVLIKFIKREKPLIDPINNYKFLDFISYIIIQQKPSIIDRLSKVINYYALKDLIFLLKIEPFNSLYEIPKLKYFEMFEIFIKKYSNKFEIFVGSYKNYKYINEKNKKNFQTRFK